LLLHKILGFNVLLLRLLVLVVRARHTLTSMLNSDIRSSGDLPIACNHNINPNYLD